MAVQFENYSIKVKDATKDAALQFLEEAASEIQTAAENNTPVDTGQLKGSWAHKVDGSAMEATIGNPLEYAIYQELGTGEYALEGNGRKGGWVYEDKKGERHFTLGNKPRRMLHKAFTAKKSIIKSRAEQIFKGLN